MTTSTTTNTIIIIINNIVSVIHRYYYHPQCIYRISPSSLSYTSPNANRSRKQIMLRNCIPVPRPGGGGGRANVSPNVAGAGAAAGSSGSSSGAEGPASRSATIGIPGGVGASGSSGSGGGGTPPSLYGTVAAAAAAAAASAAGPAATAGSYIWEDESLSKMDPVRLTALKPYFRRDGGTVTAGNASPMTDGAAASVIASYEAVQSQRLRRECGSRASYRRERWVPQLSLVKWIRNNDDDDDHEPTAGSCFRSQRFS
ncbi:hypothetical protein VOLCADRAFT_100740 [Volvox carteri f. nagariensis]|uniref:Thiolase N-terminal domain-containing protein n=1 Tax=Volvox carteri f. nagariensis TaxID=3068 RepID=D8UKX1_VOLCA|nr:uncharacterized protein VOLCADRAFT_100740 [Volvox carteri f. nagariensis]EFJ39623.1 hypothetical protein VOLCADRAFT_100740 [Volvox carteri f. nagariensis]|eukprot:XP_002959307.1 hypothetical protein VOLCADRAFT_100740 [Volvox carteri f. nagariensis]